MAVSLRSYSCKIVPAIQVISNLNRKQLFLVCNGIPESRLGILGISSRSVFLNQFFSKRSLGSIQTARVAEENQLIENPCQSKQVTHFNNWQQDVCHLNLQSFQSLSSDRNKTSCKHGIVLTQSGCSRYVYFNNTGYSQPISFNVPPNLLVSDYEKRMILLSESSKDSAPEPPKNEGGKPTPEQLKHVLDVLSDSLPKLFVQPLDYTIYHSNIIFENHIRGVRTVGIFHYVRQVALLRAIGHFKFAYVKFEILKITSHPEDGSVKVRWRIRGISGLKVFLNFWKFSILNLRETIDRETESWYDGFSTFFVGSDGKVYKHVVDKMQPDPEHKPVKPALAAKLALMLGLTPGDCVDLTQVIAAINESSRCLSDAMLPLDKIE